MDQKVAEYLPSFYNGIYKLETTEEQQTDLPIFVQKYVDEINDHNATQGVGGAFVDYSTRYAATLQTILFLSDDIWDDSLTDSVVTAVADTILTSKESIRIKLDSVYLLICIALKFPEHFKRNGIDSECVYVKKLILRRIGKAKGVSDVTREYITTKCENDPCYVVRMVCTVEIGK